MLLDTEYPYENHIGVYTNGDLFTWDEANTYCADSYGASLASIHSQSENDDIWYIVEVLNEIMQVSDVWIGINNQEWSDGTIVDYTNWDGNVTNENQGNLCGKLTIDINSNDGYWNVEHCDDTLNAFICNVNV